MLMFLLLKHKSQELVGLYPIVKHIHSLIYRKGFLQFTVSGDSLYTYIYIYLCIVHVLASDSGG